MVAGETKKIKLAHKLLAVFVLCAVAVSALLFVVWRSDGEFRVLNLDGNQYRLEVASSPDQQARGLGGRSALAENEGMLFVFVAETEHCFWMKDMNFPLDIIWLDAERQITSIKHAVSPKTYPQSFCAPAKFVIELNSGQAYRNNLRSGQTLNF